MSPKKTELKHAEMKADNLIYGSGCPNKFSAPSVLHLAIDFRRAHTRRVYDLVGSIKLFTLGGLRSSDRVKVLSSSVVALPLAAP